MSRSPIEFQTARRAILDWLKSLGERLLPEPERQPIPIKIEPRYPPRHRR